MDISERDPVPPGIFGVWDSVRLVTKRIEHVPHSDPPRVRLKFANPGYDGYECLTDQIRIVGRADRVTRPL